MPLALDHNRLRHLLREPFPPLSPLELRRQGTVFFIGGNLPVYETLETMYASYCQESSDLFLVTFAGPEDRERNLELVRQIKKNFSVRLMGRIPYRFSAALVEQFYLAGLDVLDLPHVPATAAAPADQLALFSSAATIFPRWSLVSSLPMETMPAEELYAVIDALLAAGVVPIPTMTAGLTADQEKALAATFAHLLAAWQRHGAQVRPLVPLLRLTTPLELPEPVGFLRNVISRIQDRHLLATSDLRRHLRTKEAEASFESAGL